MNLPNGTLLQSGKYRIEGVLGQGGLGITYRAHGNPVTGFPPYRREKMDYAKDLSARCLHLMLWGFGATFLWGMGWAIVFLRKFVAKNKILL